MAFFKWKREAEGHWHRMVGSDIINGVFWTANTRKLWVLLLMLLFSDVLMHGQLSSVLRDSVHHEHTDAWADLYAEPARTVCSGSVLWESGYTPARTGSSLSLWITGLHLPVPPSCYWEHWGGVKPACMQPGQGPLQPTVGDPASAGGWTSWPTEVPSNPYHSVILWLGPGQV